MADVEQSQDSGKKGSGPKTKKKSTRIDMTAMVDVAFLLLTFFVLTATMTNTNVMELTMPPKTDENIDEEDKYKKIDEKKIMTILLYENDTVKYFTGITDPEVKSTNYSETGIGKAIRGHLNYYRVLNIPRCKGRQSEGCWDPIFLIKPKPISRYKNMVDLLDELAIEGATKYAIDKFSDADSIVVAESRKRELEGEGDE